MKNIDIKFLKDNKLIIFECISGSKAYGLDLPESDTDIKGVFILPEREFYKIDYIPQISNETNDIVYFEIKRFMELVYKNNPNILEMIYTPKDSVLYMHPVFEKILNHNYLTKKCMDTFAGYAVSQIKKAKGLKKKIFNPVPIERKNLLIFCFIPDENGSVNFIDWLKKNKLQQEYCGLVKIPHMHNLYGLYYDYEGDKTSGKISLGFKGIIKNTLSNEVSLSSIPKGMKIINYLYFNKDEYSKYCRDYREYWDWINKRNDERYKNTVSHGKNYDSKNMMHTFRLLAVAEEIAVQKKINVKRPDREFLLKIRRGDFLYEDLIKKAEGKIEEIKKLYDKSDLPDKISKEKIDNILINIRRDFYNFK